MNLSISMVQTRLFWQSPSENLEWLEGRLELITGKTDIIVLPEMFTTGFSMISIQYAETMDGSAMNWMHKMAEKKNAVLVGSMMMKEEGKFYNRLIWMHPDGRFELYDKRHLFRMGNEHEHYSAGNSRIVFQLNEWKICPLICYDLRFPVWSRNRLANNEFDYDVLIYVANWPERRSHHWKTLLQARAIENQCFVVGVNRVGNDGNGLYHSGDSMVIDPLGQILYHQSKEEDIHTTILEKNQLDEVRTRLPFWKDGDHFLLV
jgi:predicted amidohydrolase